MKKWPGLAHFKNNIIGDSGFDLFTLFVYLKLSAPSGVAFLAEMAIGRATIW